MHIAIASWTRLTKWKKCLLTTVETSYMIAQRDTWEYDLCVCFRYRVAMIRSRTFANAHIYKSHIIHINMCTHLLPYIDACMYVAHVFTCAMFDFEILTFPCCVLTDAARASTSCVSSQLVIFTSPGKWHFFCVRKNRWSKRFWRTFQIFQTTPFKRKRYTEILQVWNVGWPLTSLLWYRYHVHQGTHGCPSSSIPVAGWQHKLITLLLFAKVVI